MPESDSERDRLAGVYDAWFHAVPPWAQPADPERAAAALAALCPGGPALELGSATGTLALALAARGIVVHAVEPSPAMVARMREKPGGERIELVGRNPEHEPSEGRYALIYAAHGALFWAASQDAQCRWFANAGARLAAGGAFVVHAGVPDVARFDRGQRIEARLIERDRLVLLATIHDAQRQLCRSQCVVFTEAGTALYLLEQRYAWPSELDLMAELAGLRLRARWSSFAGEPFGAAAPAHVSVYERTAPEH